MLKEFEQKMKALFNDYDIEPYIEAINKEHHEVLKRYTITHFAQDLDEVEIDALLETLTFDDVQDHYHLSAEEVVENMDEEDLLRSIHDDIIIDYLVEKGYEVEIAE